MILQFLANGLVNGSMIALVALGFSLVYNTTRVFHIAYAGIYVWAGYLLYWFADTLDWPLWAAFLMAMAGAAVLSMLSESLLYAPLSRRGRSHDSLMISSVGMLILLVSMVELIWGNAPRFFTYDWDGIAVNDYISPLRLASLIIGFAAIGLFFIFLKSTRLGIRLRALRDNEDLLGVFGVDAVKVKYLIYFLSGLIVAIAAGLGALDVGVHPGLGIPVFINAFVAMVIGGIGRFDGPVLGGILLGLLQSMTEYFFDSRWVMMVTFILLIVFLMMKPQGLIAEKRRAF